MTHTIKALSLLLTAMLAMAAVIAATAQAAPKFTLSDTAGDTVNTATFTSTPTEGNHKLTIDGSSLECGNVEGSGNIEDGATNVTIHTAYSECNAFGFLSATVNTSNCNYRMMANAETSAGVFADELEVVCTAGTSITITAGTCEAKINGGTVINTGGNITNVTSNEHMHLKLHHTNSQTPVQKTKDGFGCPFNGTGNTTGTLNGTTTMKAYATATSHNDGNQVNLTVSP